MADKYCSPSGKVRTVNLTGVRKSAPRHEALTDYQLDRVRKIYSVLGQHLGPFEQFELDFLRDMHPDREIAVWAKIAAAYQAYGEKTGDEGQQVYDALLTISLGARRKPPGVSDHVWAQFVA